MCHTQQCSCEDSVVASNAQRSMVLVQTQVSNASCLHACAASNLAVYRTHQTTAFLVHVLKEGKNRIHRLGADKHETQSNLLLLLYHACAVDDGIQSNFELLKVPWRLTCCSVRKLWSGCCCAAAGRTPLVACLGGRLAVQRPWRWRAGLLL